MFWEGSILEQNCLGVKFWFVSFFTLPLGPLEAEIYVFTDGLSENDWKSINKRDHKFCSSALIFAGTANFFFPTWKGVPRGLGVWVLPLRRELSSSSSLKARSHLKHRHPICPPADCQDENWTFYNLAVSTTSIPSSSSSIPSSQSYSSSSSAEIFGSRLRGWGSERRSGRWGWWWLTTGRELQPVSCLIPPRACWGRNGQPWLGWCEEAQDGGLWPSSPVLGGRVGSFDGVADACCEPADTLLGMLSRLWSPEGKFILTCWQFVCYEITSKIGRLL